MFTEPDDADVSDVWRMAVRVLVARDADEAVDCLHVMLSDYSPVTVDPAVADRVTLPFFTAAKVQQRDNKQQCYNQRWAARAFSLPRYRSRIKKVGGSVLEKTRLESRTRRQHC
jgi:hypothetical protein